MQVFFSRAARTGLVVSLTALAALAPAARAAPATVHLRVEGSSTTLFDGPVATNAKTLTKDASGPHPCDGTNGGANPTPGPTMTTALDDGALAGGFTWAGTWFDGFQDFGIDRIGSDSNGGAPTFPSWGYALNFTPSQVGGCQQQVQNGDDVLFAYDFFSKAHLLKLAGPGSANTGEAVRVTVTDGQNGTPVAGASVGGQVTGPDGGATLTFTSTGVHPLKAESPDSVRSNTVAVCVHNGADGACGSGSDGVGAVGGGSGSPQTLDSTGPAARISGIRRGRRFSARRAPRLLKGTVGVDPSGVKAVYIRLWRHDRGRCFYLSWRTETLRRGACGGHRDLVYAGKGPDWSYLLAFTPPRGHYRVDAIAVDGHGNGSAISAGVNRVDFYVR
jgi:hypothetical protein